MGNIIYSNPGISCEHVVKSHPLSHFDGGPAFPGSYYKIEMYEVLYKNFFLLLVFSIGLKKKG